VIHNFGDAEYTSGTKKIDFRKFVGPRSKVEATADFINNIVNIHHKHLQKHEERMDQLAEDGQIEDEPIETEEQTGP
jgi:hypothetical protein